MDSDTAVMISVARCQAVVSRSRRPAGTLVCERATRAEDGERAALRAVVTRGTSRTPGTHYRCPADLARPAQGQCARWPHDRRAHHPSPPARPATPCTGRGGG